MLRPVISWSRTTSNRSTHSSEARTRPPRRAAEAVGDPLHLPLFGAPAVAVGPEGGALAAPGSLVENHDQNPSKATSSPASMSGSHEANPTCSERRRRPAVGDPRAPQVTAVVGVLHVDVDLDVGPGHGDHSTPPAVRRRHTDPGRGQFDLGRPHSRRPPRTPTASSRRTIPNRPPSAVRAPTGPRTAWAGSQ